MSSSKATNSWWEATSGNDNIVVSFVNTAGAVQVQINGAPAQGPFQGVNTIKVFGYDGTNDKILVQGTDSH